MSNLDWGAIESESWADTLAGLGNCEEWCRRGRLDRVGVYYRGRSEQMASFIEDHPKVGRVVHVKDAAPLPRGVEVLSVCQNECYLAPFFPRQARLHRRFYIQAARLLAEQFEGFSGQIGVLLPYSLQYVPMDGHWPHWVPAMKWLVDALPESFRLILMGQTPKGNPFQKVPIGWVPSNHARVFSLIDRIKDFRLGFALAEMADFIISASTGMAVWAVTRSLPAVVCTGTHLEAERYWLRGLDGPTNRLVQSSDNLNVFQEEVAGLINHPEMLVSNKP